MIPRMVRQTLLAATLAVLTQTATGCALHGYRSGPYDTCTNKPLPALLDATDLKTLFQDMAAELCTDIRADCAPLKTDGMKAVAACSPGDEAPLTTVLVTDFVDLQTFTPNQQGLVMGELMRAGLAKVCYYRLTQAEFATYFKLSESGLVALTRNAGEIKNGTYFQTEAIVGTYSHLNNNKVLIFARKINMATGRIFRMATREVTYSCSGKQMKYSVAYLGNSGFPLVQDAAGAVAGQAVARLAR